jgi:hypothetical protein
VVVVMVDARAYVDVAKVLGSLGRQLREPAPTLLHQGYVSDLHRAQDGRDEQTGKLIRYLSLAGKQG